MNEKINIDDIICIKDIKLSEKEIKICQKINDFTNNTWQPNRSTSDKLHDTVLGKIAEKALKIYFTQNNMVNLIPCVLFYDDFRNDDFKKHNSIDLIFLKIFLQLIKLYLI